MRVIREALTSFLRCEVDTSPNPEYGFELALKKTYDLLIFDFSMPMIDGAMLFFLIGKVYNHAEPPRIVPPLLLVTGKGDESTRAGTVEGSRRARARREAIRDQSADSKR